MKSQITKIEVITEIGTFTFKEHFNSDCHFYQALCNFVGNNWQMLGEHYYQLYREFDNGKVIIDTYKGINASCELAANFDESTKQYLNDIYQSNY